MKALRAVDCRTLLATLLALLACAAYAQPVTGTVVGVSDGDTVTVLLQQRVFRYFVFLLHNPLF